MESHVPKILKWKENIEILKYDISNIETRRGSQNIKTLLLTKEYLEFSQGFFVEVDVILQEFRWLVRR